jgi:hypothetical protein
MERRRELKPRLEVTVGYPDVREPGWEGVPPGIKGEGILEEGVEGAWERDRQMVVVDWTDGTRKPNKCIMILSSSPHKKTTHFRNTWHSYHLHLIVPAAVAVTRKESASIRIGLIQKRTHFTRKPLMKTHWSWVMLEFCSPWN